MNNNNFKLKGKQLIGFLFISFLFFLAFALVSGATFYDVDDVSGATRQNATEELNYTHLNISSLYPYDTLTAYWTFDKDGRDFKNGYDLTAQLNNVSLSNSSYRIYGNAYSSIGNGYAAYNVDDYTATNCSISMWVKGNVIGQAAATGLFATGGVAAHSFQIETAGVTNLYRLRATDDYNNLIIVNFGADSTEWEHLAMVVNATGTYTYYNGVYSANSPVLNSTCDWTIYKVGSNRAGGSYFNGHIDEVMIFDNKSLTPAEISAIYNNQSARFVDYGYQNLTAFNITAGNNKINVTISSFENLLGSNVSVRFAQWSAGWQNYTAWENVTAGKNQTFSIQLDTNYVMPEIRLVKGDYNFYTPILDGSFTAYSERKLPNISYVTPTYLNGTETKLTEFYINVTANADILDTISIFFYNSTKEVERLHCSSSPCELFVSGLGTEDYFFNATVNDTGGINNSLTTREVRVDTKAPSVKLTLPINNTYSTTSWVNFECNSSDDRELKNVSLYIWNTDNGMNQTNTTDITGTSNSSTFNQTLSDDSYYWNCIVSDDFNYSNLNATNYTLTVDSKPPVFNVLSPTNTTYKTIIVNFNISITEINPETCILSLDDFTTNTTMTAINSTYYGYRNVTMDYGVHTASYWCNDTAGNSNHTEITFSVKGFSGCGTISAIGTYYLDRNVVNHAGNCIVLGGDNITIDGNGYAIDGDDTGSDYGVLSNTYDNITVRNFANISDFNVGVRLQSGKYGLVTNNTLDYNRADGINFMTQTDSNATNNYIYRQMLRGIDLYGADRNIIENNTLEYIGQFGIYLDNTAENNTIINNSINYTGHQAVELVGSNPNTDFADNKLSYNNKGSIITYPSINSREQIYSAGEQVKLNLTIKYSNESAAVSWTNEGVVVYPSETATITTAGKWLNISFTPTQYGIYGVIVNVSTTDGDREISKYMVMIGDKKSDRQLLYFRSTQPKSQQPFDSDTGTLLETAPTGIEYVNCSTWVQHSPDLIKQPIFVLKNVSAGWTYKTTINGNAKLQRYVTYNNLGDFQTTMSLTSGYEWDEWEINDKNVSYQYVWSNYYSAIKLHGDTVSVRSNATQPSYIYYEYYFTGANVSQFSPATPNRDIRDVRILSASLPSNDGTDNVTMVVEGEGNYTLAVAFTDGNYRTIEYDGVDCATSGDCILNSNSSSLVNITFRTGGLHTIELKTAKKTPSITLNFNPVSPITFGTSFTASCYSNSDGTMSIYRNSTDVTSQNATSVSLGAGNYNYTCEFTGTASYLAGLTSSTMLINKAMTTCSITTNTPVTYPNNVSVTASCTNPEQSDVFTRNGTTISSPYNHRLAGNTTYLFNISDTSSQNYTANHTTASVVVNQGAGEVNTYLSNVLNNSYRNNITIYNGSSIWLNGTRVTGEVNIKLYLNVTMINIGDTLIGNWTNFNSGAAEYNVTSILPESENYTKDSETWWVIVLATPTTQCDGNFTILTFAGENIRPYGRLCYWLDFR